MTMGEPGNLGDDSATIARVTRDLKTRSKGWPWAQSSAHLGSARRQVSQEIHVGEIYDP